MGMTKEGTLSISPVSNDTLSDRVYDRLARALMTGEFRPGASLTLRDAAELVGTSIMPVREALWQLTTQRAMILQRNKAIYIPLLSETEFDHLWHLRELLEGEACAQAAHVIQAAEVAGLSVLVRETLSAAEAKDMRPLIVKAHEFFFRIYRSTLNSMLVSMIEMLWLRTGPLYYETLSSDSNLAFIRKSLKHNTRLFEALRAGDAAAARATREKDLRELAEWLRRHRQRAQNQPRQSGNAQPAGKKLPAGAAKAR